MTLSTSYHSSAQPGYKHTTPNYWNELLSAQHERGWLNPIAPMRTGCIEYEARHTYALAKRAGKRVFFTGDGSKPPIVNLQKTWLGMDCRGISADLRAVME